jgi:TRAP-type mannitol/chloroaromatic compound transport system permease small subunit
MVIIANWEVISRYVFNHPTIWAWDVNLQILAAFAVIGGGYALLHGAQVTVDTLVSPLSPGKRAMLDLITSAFFLFAIGVVLWKTTMAAWSSIQTLERSETFFAPPVYPLRTIIAVGVLLLMVQAIAKFIRDLVRVGSERRRGKP